MIIFTSNRGGSAQIYVMYSDGSVQTPLTSGFDRATAAASSPDGTKIAFAASRDGNPTTQICVMNADGSGVTQLTNETHIPSNARATWSPDGAQMAFTLASTTLVINSDGSGKHRLSTTWAGSLQHADWSPDGTRFVFQGLAPDPDRTYGLFVIDAGGSEVTRLTRGYQDNPVWSPDGARIAFNGPGPIGIGTHIYLMNADGSGVTNLTQDKQGGWSEPAWSPDGQKLAFGGALVGGTPQIHVMNPDGSGEAILTSDPGGNYSPNWRSMQGPKIVDSGSSPLDPNGPGVLSG